MAARPPGRRPQKALTARFVETVTNPGKYFDGNGLFLRVETNGSRRWVQRITIQGKRSEVGLGSPPAISLAVARQRALENKGLVMQGGDPLAVKRQTRQALTFAEAVDIYLASKLNEFKNEKHRKQWRSTLDTYAAPLLGRKDVAEISVQDVLRVLEPIWKQKTETASRLRGRIENVLSWATVAGHRDGDNPARWKGNLSELMPKPNKIARSENQPALAVADIPRWWKELESKKGTASSALRFLTLTAARSGEVRGMTWDEIASDSDQGEVWTIPATRMKNGRPHRVPLPVRAVALLNDLPRLEGSPFVFFAPQGGALSDMSLSAVMRRMQATQERVGKPGYLDPVSKRPAVPHGLRSTFRQWAAERGYPRDMAELALAHWIGSEVERAYQRADMLARRREMMEAWARFLFA
ncbi:site-specific integrase [Pararhodobacter sp. CCB-MM2]|uniref:tyrosine-type recombinase/integrase n=1 Tax=Pararhodobacter sp. CCB-MM2 TaxID=1786003 RepID=UPI00082CB292|nr:site-specific integrase [Pararhodobacter sp. CCB-MM2]